MRRYLGVCGEEFHNSLPKDCTLRYVYQLYHTVGFSWVHYLLLFVHITPTFFLLTLCRGSQKKGNNLKLSFRFAMFLSDITVVFAYYSNSNTNNNGCHLLSTCQ